MFVVLQLSKCGYFRLRERETLLCSVLLSNLNPMQILLI